MTVDEQWHADLPTAHSENQTRLLLYVGLRIFCFHQEWHSCNSHWELVEFMDKVFLAMAERMLWRVLGHFWLTSKCCDQGSHVSSFHGLSTPKKKYCWK